MHGRRNNPTTCLLVAIVATVTAAANHAVAQTARTTNAPSRSPETPSRPPLEIELRQSPGTPAVFIKHEGPYWTIRRSVDLVRDYARTKSLAGDVFIQYGTTPRGTISPSAPLRVGILLPAGSTHIPAAPMERATVGAGLIARATADVPPSQNWRTLWELQRAAGRKGYRAAGEAMEIYPAGKSGGSVIIAMTVEPIAHSRAGSGRPPKIATARANAAKPETKRLRPAEAKRSATTPIPTADGSSRTTVPTANDSSEPARTAADATAADNPSPKSQVKRRASAAIRSAIERGEKSKSKHLAPGEFAFSANSRVITPPPDESPSADAPINESAAEPPASDTPTTPNPPPPTEAKAPEETASTGPPAEAKMSLAEMIRDDQFKRAAAEIISPQNATDPASLTFLDQLTFRARAAADAIAERDPAIATRARELSAALRSELERARAAAAAAARKTIIHSVAAAPRVSKDRSALLRDFDQLLMQLATERIAPAAAWDEMLDLLTQAAAIGALPRSESNTPENP